MNNIRTSFFAAIAATLFIMGSTSFASAEAQKIGVVGNVSGSVTATNKNGNARTLESGSSIYLNEMIVSDAGAKAQIMFLDKSSLMINANTNVTVDKFVFDPATASGDLSIQNAKGALRFIGGALSKKKPVTINTPVATIGIRGGIADTHVALNGATDAVFRFGDEMTMANAKGQIQRITEIGKGLSLLDANSIPVPLPAARAAALSASFSGKPATNGAEQDDSEGGGGADNKSNMPKSDGQSKKQDGMESMKHVEAKQENTSSASAMMGERMGEVNQGDQREHNVVEYNKRAFTPTDAGSYVVSRISNNNVIHSGRTNLERVGDRLNGRLIQNQPDSTAAPVLVSLPWLQNAGYQSVTASSSGNSFSGGGYKTSDNALHFYDLRRNGFRLATMVGRIAPQASWSNSAAASAAFTGNTQNNLSFYDFLPDLAGFTSNQTNFFNYNMASDQFAFGDGIGNDNLGLVVNWNTNRFITGRINWANDGTDNSRDLVLAFGETESGGKLLDGHVYEFLSLGNQTVQRAGGLEVDEAFSSADGEAFSGFLLDGQVDGTDGPRITQGVVQGDINDAAIISASSSNGNVQTGFAAGFIGTTTGNTTTYNRYGNEHVNDVKITPDAANGNVSASFNLEHVDIAGQTIEADFGVVGLNSADSAYLTDDLYAAGQSYYQASDGTGFNGTDVSGVLVSAPLIAGVASQCDACEYVNWGVWAGEVDRTAGGATVTDTANLIPYVAGAVTQNLQANVSTQSLGQVNYRGDLFGSTLDGGNLSRHEGAFTAGINLDNRKLTDFNADIAGLNFGFAGENHSINSTGNAVFSNVAVQGLGGATGVTGSINGALFGPNAEDIGGNFAIEQTVTGIEATGVYTGTRN